MPVPCSDRVRAELQYSENVETETNLSFADNEVTSAHILIGGSSDGVGDKQLKVMPAQSDIDAGDPAIEPVGKAEGRRRSIAGNDRSPFGEEREDVIEMPLPTDSERNQRGLAL